MKHSRRRPAPPSVERVMRALARAITGLTLPAVEKISEEQAEDPFRILIATILSARTQDATTHTASTRLFRAARTPRSMAALPVRTIERLVYPVSFYKHKARYVKACCEMLLTHFGGDVPSTLEALMQLPSVGRKTANLVLILGFKSLRGARRFRERPQLVRGVQIVVAILAARVPPPLRRVPPVKPHVVETRDVGQVVLADREPKLRLVDLHPGGVECVQHRERLAKGVAPAPMSQLDRDSIIAERTKQLRQVIARRAEYW